MDYSKYRISSTPIGMSSLTHASYNTTTIATDIGLRDSTSASRDMGGVSSDQASAEDDGDCFCADEDDLFEHDLSPAPKE